MFTTDRATISGAFDRDLYQVIKNYKNDGSIAYDECQELVRSNNLAALAQSLVNSPVYDGVHRVSKSI